MQKQKKTKKPNDIATNNTTTNPEPQSTAAGGSSRTQPTFPAADQATLRAQGVTSLALAITFAAGLARRGRTDQDNQELSGAVSSFDTAYKNRRERRAASKQATAAFQTDVQDALLFREELVAGLRIATGKQNPFTEKKLQLGSSTKPKQLGLWFESVVSEVQLHKAELDARFGEDTVALVAGKAAKLMQSIGAHSLALKQAKTTATEQRDARVRLAAAIAKLRFTAEMAFPGDKEVLQQFGYAWNQKRAGKKGSQPQQPGSGAAAAATPAAAAPVEPSPASPSPVAPAPVLAEAAVANPAQLAEGKGVSS